MIIISLTFMPDCGAILRWPVFLFSKHLITSDLLQQQQQQHTEQVVWSQTV